MALALSSRLVCGDCFEVLPTIPDNSVDFILTSPPYDSLRDYDGFPVFDVPKRIALGRELYRVAKPGTVCAVVVQDQVRNGIKSLTSFRLPIEWCDSADWRLFETLIYRRDGAPGNHYARRFRVDHEYVHLFVKGKRVARINKDHLRVRCKGAGEIRNVGRRNADGSLAETTQFVCPEYKCRGSVWSYQASCYEGNRRKLRHPATFPDALAADLIRAFSDRNDVVLDPMVGSGTTYIASRQYGRRCIGVELSARYVRIAEERAEIEVPTDVFDEEYLSVGV